MASYHLTAKIGNKGKAAAHAAYIAREGKYSGRDRYEDLEATGSGNMPEWSAHNAAHFWQAADEHERVNGSVYREIEVALPREFTPSQRLELVQEFIEQEIGDKHAYQFAIHTPKAALEKDDQPHAHIMYSERIRDGIERDPERYFKRYNAKNPEKGGAKKFSGGKHKNELKAELLSLRERWATLQNTHLEKYGHNDRVDHRSLKDQGIDREPEKHLGAIGVSRLNTHDISALLERRSAEGELERARREVSIIDLSGDLEKAKADRLDESLKSYQPLFDSAAKKAVKDGFTERDQVLFQEQVKEHLIKNIELGVMPRINKKISFEIDAIEKSAKQPAEKPEPLKNKLAERTLSRLIEEERVAWRKNEETRLLKEAEKIRQAAWKLKAEEPKKPLLGLYATDTWKYNIAIWERDLQYKIDEFHEHNKQAQDAIDGKSGQEHWQRVAFHEKAEQRLKTEHPDLAKALMEQRQAEQQKAALARAKATADKAADKAVADFKVLATKREGKFLGYGDSGKKWGALSDELKATIESFNKQPATAQGVALELMLEKIKRTPGAVEKLTQQMEQGKDRGFER
ncbi:MAG: MobA/MobL family protein [Methylococcaceae bacterium]